VLDPLPFQIQGKPTLEIYQVKNVVLSAPTASISAINYLTWTWGFTAPFAWVIYQVGVGVLQTLPGSQLHWQFYGPVNAYQNVYMYGINSGGTHITANSNQVTPNLAPGLTIDGNDAFHWTWTGTNPYQWVIYQLSSESVLATYAGTLRDSGNLPQAKGYNCIVYGVDSGSNQITPPSPNLVAP